MQLWLLVDQHWLQLRSKLQIERPEHFLSFFPDSRILVPEGLVNLSHESAKQLFALGKALEFKNLRLVLILVEEAEAGHDHVAVSEIRRNIILLLLRASSR